MKMSLMEGLNIPLPKLLGLASLKICGGNLLLKLPFLPFNKGLIITSF